jgi:hypothetical protein
MEAELAGSLPGIKATAAAIIMAIAPIKIYC